MNIADLLAELDTLAAPFKRDLLDYAWEAERAHIERLAGIHLALASMWGDYAIEHLRLSNEGGAALALAVTDEPRDPFDGCPLETDLQQMHRGFMGVWEVLGAEIAAAAAREHVPHPPALGALFGDNDF